MTFRELYAMVEERMRREETQALFPLSFWVEQHLRFEALKAAYVRQRDARRAGDER